MFTATKVVATHKNGTSVLHNISVAIKKGENCATKQRTHCGSKEFSDAIFPVPKNAKII